MRHASIHLEGENLGARHRHYNFILRSCVDQNIQFQEIVDNSPIENIFKIDLASENKNVEYILKVLQDEDMLYVSRALKCIWLLDPQYKNVINPRYLETNLFPYMIQPAVNKMKKWLQLTLKDPGRCQDFYDYYKDNFNVAVKYLYHCSPEIIVQQFPNVIDKLSPKNFKVMCEVCPQVSKVYFNSLPTNQTALHKYLKNECNFFDSLKQILKIDGNLYLDIMEKHFNEEKVSKLNPSATHYIMKNFKNRFQAKQELYATKFLHMKSLAKYLSAEEARYLTTQLARAEFLQHWFSYKNVEPLIKRLNPNERAQFKQQIFVDKSVGDTIKEWPYPIPAPFELNYLDSQRIFLDEEHYPYMYDQPEDSFKKRLMNRKYCSYGNCDIAICRKSQLDIIFDRYRVLGFERTFQEISKKMSSENTVEGRLNMLLVLVSKSGGVESQVEKLLKWLVEKHINEPIHLRAAIIRSLVKRGCVWRVPLDTWKLFVDYGRDLGLHGQHAELLCREGLHAVVIRQYLTNSELEPDLLTAFIKEFSTLQEYNLNLKEKAEIGKRLATNMIEKDPYHLLDVIAKYNLKIHQIKNGLNYLVKMAKNDTDLVRKLYDAKIGRREIIQQSFPLFQNNASFMNALRHDVSLLDGGKYFAALAKEGRPCHDQFLRSLCLYFNEPNGLAAQHRVKLEETFTENPTNYLARPICILSTQTAILDLLSKFDITDVMEKEDKKIKQFAASIRANVHKTKPPLDVEKVDWQWIGTKAIANRYFICRSKDLDNTIELLLKSKRTARIALRLALMTPYSVKTFKSVSSLRPSIALKIALSVFFNEKTVESEIWNATKQLIEKLDSKTNERLLNKLRNIKRVPENIKASYWVAVMHLFLKVDKRNVAPIVCKLENMLPDVEDGPLEFVIQQFISDHLNNDESKETMSNLEKCLYFRIIAKYLLLCTSKSSQVERIEGICDSLFNKLGVLFQTAEEKSKNKNNLKKCIKDFLRSLKYNRVFLDKRYISCLPVYERIVERLREILPTEKNFGMYVEIHLTMLYYKSIQQAIKQKPGIFDDLEINHKQAVEMVGLIFGTYIGREMKELTSVYCFSIIEIYKEVLKNYLNDYFEYNDRMSMLVVFVIKGLINVGYTEAMLLVEYLHRNKYHFIIPKSHEDEIFEALKECKSKEVSFLVNEHICS